MAHLLSTLLVLVLPILMMVVGALIAVQNQKPVTQTAEAIVVVGNLIGGVLLFGFGFIAAILVLYL